MNVYMLAMCEQIWMLGLRNSVSAVVLTVAAPLAGTKLGSCECSNEPYILNHHTLPLVLADAAAATVFALAPRSKCKDCSGGSLCENQRDKSSPYQRALFMLKWILYILKRALHNECLCDVDRTEHIQHTGTHCSMLQHMLQHTAIRTWKVKQWADLWDHVINDKEYIERHSCFGPTLPFQCRDKEFFDHLGMWTCAKIPVFYRKGPHITYKQDSDYLLLHVHTPSSVYIF